MSDVKRMSKERLAECKIWLGGIEEPIGVSRMVEEFLTEVEELRKDVANWKKTANAAVTGAALMEKSLDRLCRVEKAATLVAEQSHRDSRGPHMDHVPAVSINALKRELPWPPQSHFVQRADSSTMKKGILCYARIFSGITEFLRVVGHPAAQLKSP